MLLEALRAEVLDTARRMLADGIAHGSQGNVSALDPESGWIAITPSAIEYDVMQVEDITIIDKDGQVVEGKWKPTSEAPMHTLLYREGKDIGAVVHSHAPYATVFALINTPIPVVLVEAACCIGKPVPIAPFYTPGTEELGRIALETMGSGVAVLLANHGLLSVGSNLAQAYETTVAVETTARLVIMARSMNAEPIELHPDIVTMIREVYLQGYKRTPTS